MDGTRKTIIKTEKNCLVRSHRVLSISASASDKYPPIIICYPNHHGTIRRASNYQMKFSALLPFRDLSPIRCLTWFHYAEFDSPFTHICQGSLALGTRKLSTFCLINEYTGTKWGNKCPAVLGNKFVPELQPRSAAEN